MRVNNSKHNMIGRDNKFNVPMIQHSCDTNILSHTQTAVFPGNRSGLEVVDFHSVIFSGGELQFSSGMESSISAARFELPGSSFSWH